MIKMEKNDKGLVIVVSNLEKDGNTNFDPTRLLFLDRYWRLTEFKESLNFHSVFDAGNGLYFASDFNFVCCFDGKNEITGDADVARQYGLVWDNFFKINKDVFCLRYGLVTKAIDLVQLTLSDVPDFDKVDRGFRLIDDKLTLIHDFVLGESNEAYVSEEGGLWRKLHLKFDNGKISREDGVHPVQGRRQNPPHFVYHNGKMYDYQGNEVYETDSNTCIFRTPSQILDVHKNMSELRRPFDSSKSYEQQPDMFKGLEDLLCLTEDGDINNVMLGESIAHPHHRAKGLSSFRGYNLYFDDDSIHRVYDNAEIFNLRQKGIDGRIVQVLPIHGGWFIDWLSAQNKGDKTIIAVIEGFCPYAENDPTYKYQVTVVTDQKVEIDSQLPIPESQLCICPYGNDGCHTLGKVIQIEDYTEKRAKELNAVALYQK